MKKNVFILLGIVCLIASAYTTKMLVEKGEVKGFAKPEDVREFPKGKLELIKIGGANIGKATFQPGWRWSTSVQPLAKTTTCEAPHFQYHVSGVLNVKMDDGTILECKPGDVSYLPMGHDAWVVGNEPVVVIDFHGMLDYAKEKK
jgi:mannose-6-phosphate isomerase-like protein (cupin superfamily)